MPLKVQVILCPDRREVPELELGSDLVAVVRRQGQVRRDKNPIHQWSKVNQ